MTDVLFIAILVAFFALMIGFVRVCERVVGRQDPIELDGAPPGTPATEPGGAPAGQGSPAGDVGSKQDGNGQDGHGQDGNGQDGHGQDGHGQERGGGTDATGAKEAAPV